MENAKEIKVYFGAAAPPDENGKMRHMPHAWYFADVDYSSPVPFSPAFETEEAALAGARAHCARFTDRYVADG